MANKMNSNMSNVVPFPRMPNPPRTERGPDRRGKTLVHAADARSARAIDLHFADGRVAATVGDALAVVAPVSRRVERKGANPYPSSQPNLFDRED